MIEAVLEKLVYYNPGVRIQLAELSAYCVAYGLRISPTQLNVYLHKQYDGRPGVKCVRPFSVTTWVGIDVRPERRMTPITVG